MNKLTFKQKQFCKELVETRNATEAAFRSYNLKNRNVASLVGHINLKKPHILAEIEKLMDEQNITDEFMMGQLKAGLKADVVTAYKGKAEQTKIPDHNTRFKYWEAGAKLKSYFPPTQTDSRSINIDLQLEQMSKKELSDLLKKLLISINEPILQK